MPHGVMFHHFHDDAHPRGQGAMSADELERMIRHLGLDRVLPAREWQRRAEAGTLGGGDLCLTFDDNLRCQFDVAVPVLRQFGLTAFWFVYTSVLQGRLERLELYRFFRTVRYPSTEAFYDAFLATVLAGPDGDAVRARLARFRPADHLRDFPFYTDADRTFRFVRDDVLGPARYVDVMDRMMAGEDLAALGRGLWMGGAELRQLHREGHVIGLHSHTHPTRLGELPAAAQRAEYAANQAALTDLLGERPTTMSHPCNSYSAETGPVLADLGVRLGFRANMAPPAMAPAAHGPLEHPREDHANLLRRMAA